MISSRDTYPLLTVLVRGLYFSGDHLRAQVEGQ